MNLLVAHQGAVAASGIGAHVLDAWGARLDDRVRAAFRPRDGDFQLTPVEVLR